MDIDIDWCLTCEKRIDSNTIYCSPECQSHAAPQPTKQPQQQFRDDEDNNDDDDDFSDDGDDDLVVHVVEDSLQSTWIEDWELRIQVWAAQIPPGPPPGESDLVSSPKTPSLLKSHRHVLPPTLAMSTPHQASVQSPSSSTPLVTPKRHSSVNSVAAQYASMGDTSAATTESSIATPASAHNIPSRKPSVLNLVYDQVRSWVAPSPLALSSQQHLKSLHQQHPPTDKERVQPRPSVLTIPHNSPLNPHILSDQTTVCWVAGTVVLDSKPSRSFHDYPISSSPSPNSRGPEAHHSSFRTRGRKASRAAA